MSTSAKIQICKLLSACQSCRFVISSPVWYPWTCSSPSQAPPMPMVVSSWSTISSVRSAPALTAIELPSSASSLLSSEVTRRAASRETRSTPVMRYDSWDVILFPRDSHIPIQEFKTACYVSRDEYNRQLPTLNCYITSLPATTPFRISVHSWAAKARSSALIESQRRPNQRVVYIVQVIVDGTRVFHDFYELSSKWPQELVYEKRSIADYDRHSRSQRKPLLQFPSFHQSILMQSSWDARDHDGRIKLVLSEQLVGKSHNPSEVEFGAVNDIICFSFQHAPKEILEQAGISWPIRNPLYLSPPNDNELLASQLPSTYRRPLNPVVDTHKQSPNSRQFQSPISRASISEPTPRPRTEPPRFSQFPKPPGRGRGHGRAGVWTESYDDTFIDPFDDTSVMDTDSMRRTSSNLTADISMPDLILASPASVRSKNNQRHQNRSSGHDRHSNWADGSGNRNRGDKHVVVTLREDQFGQLVEALSPPKRTLDSHRNEHPRSQLPQPKSHGNPPKMGPMTVPSSSRPSAAALARTASYPDFHPHLRNVSNTASPGKLETGSYKIPYKGPTNHVFDGGKENRNPSENRVPTPHPFLQGPVWGQTEHKLTPYTSDIEMRNPSSVFSNTFHFERGSQQQPPGKHSPTPTPSTLKSRKEGLGIASPAVTEQEGKHTDKDIRCEKSFLLDLENVHTSPKMHVPAPHNTPRTMHVSPQTRFEKILNPEEPQAFIQGHRSGMSSMGRVEAELFSALGDELNSFNENFVETPSLPELSPLVKRKRAGTLGGERGKSPNTKMVKERKDGGDDGLNDDGRVELELEGPKMRGGD
ncbi:hypothetical protein K491DRAFT_333864 [Lophiostoma macrostomum CBS 122681]|uniref:Uncharacterized protein n=1 Tax=Lophiostoma macrostomum CBS 122681 TaxID=1314788 RepID=A0A6A6TTD3_9PLEO|nr:hypothetical protein K491DRAFT_333864 [Lophiostoma macrostomum CBS 122681]